MKLQYIPINEKKIPLVPKWQTSEDVHDLTIGYGVGLVCGAPSDGLFCIDIDLKYDITGTLFQRYKKAINDADPELLSKLTVQSTISKGYHFIYRCKTTDGNLKLAQRYATPEEQKKGDKVKVLLETRGNFGYFACAPTKGYKLVYGTFETISEITPQEHETLLSVARTFNEVIKERIAPKTTKKQIKGMTSFEDYNSRADVISLLEKHGWTICQQKGSKTLFKRPGQTSAAHSGNYDSDKNWFSVFSTSTEFETETAYLPYAVFAILECRGDFSEASKRLYEEGYGDRFEDAKGNEVKIASRIDVLSDDYTFVATESDYEDYLKSWRDGTFIKGKKTGFSIIDEYFRHKDNTLVMFNGLDNVGKSTFLWYLALLNAVFSGDKWIIISAENSVGTVMRKMIEFYWCEAIEVMNKDKFNTAKEFINQHFAIIKTDDTLYNYKDVLSIGKKMLKKDNYKRMLIDPYNALVIDLPKESKLSTHEYHYQAASELKLFTKQNDISIYLNLHVVTTATRLVKGETTVPAPRKADTEGGSKFPNKADDFLTIHRHTEDSERWMWTEIFVRKVKETETGGRPTFFDTPIKLRAAKGLLGFEDENGFNPILSYHGLKTTEVPPMTKMKPNISWSETDKPYSDDSLEL